MGLTNSWITLFPHSYKVRNGKLSFQPSIRPGFPYNYIYDFIHPTLLLIYSAWGKVTTPLIIFRFVSQANLLPWMMYKAKGCIKLLKWSFWGPPNCREGLHIRGIISVPAEGYWAWNIGSMERHTKGLYCIFWASACMSHACLRCVVAFPHALYVCTCAIIMTFKIPTYVFPYPVRSLQMQPAE